ncbi:hypothetical protein B8W96_01245 [Lentilactobacillus parakefiri]|uniref:hypothetical protein n=1 Tax=Lentilactobacillus parakefiri TaxID=152332 RepID=UPI000BA50393|nr:hypothetical protein [Lentilactobacillus parakefiri]PAL01568.1 hypothetical protein B8W96_01245 [Lentilactobacillus parakefiri]
MNRYWYLKVLLILACVSFYMGLQASTASANRGTYSTTPTTLRGTWYYNDQKGWYTKISVTKTTVSQMNQRAGLVVSLKSHRVKLIKPNKYGYWQIKVKGYRPIVLKSAAQDGQPAIKGRFAGKVFSTGTPVYAYHYLPNKLAKDYWTSIPDEFLGSWATHKNTSSKWREYKLSFKKSAMETIVRQYPGVFLGAIMLGTVRDPVDPTKSSLIFSKFENQQKIYWGCGLRNSKYLPGYDSRIFIRHIRHEHQNAIKAYGISQYFYKTK